MVRVCAVKNCREKSVHKKADISFHTFPVNDERKRQWLQGINYTNFVPSKNSCVCSKHFEKDCFIGNRLRKDACPTITDIPNIELLKSRIQEKLIKQEVDIKDEIDVTASCSKVNTPADSVAAPGCVTPSSAIIPDLEMDCDSDTSSSISSAKHLIKRFIPLSKQYESPKSTSSSSSISDMVPVSPEDKIIGREKCNSPTSSTTLTASETRIEIKKKSKRYWNPKYVGDCLSDDMISPEKSERNWKIAKQKIQMQKKKITYLHQRRRRLESRVKKLTDLKNKSNASEKADLTASLPDSAKALFEKMLRGPKNQKYSPELRSFALTLYVYSEKAYDFVRKKFNNSLPHPTTLTKWFPSDNDEPGLTQEALEAINVKVSEANDRGTKICCNLVEI